MAIFQPPAELPKPLPRALPNVMLAADPKLVEKAWKDKGQRDADVQALPGFQTHKAGGYTVWVESALVTPPDLAKAQAFIERMRANPTQSLRAADLSAKDRQTLASLIGKTALGQTQMGLDQASRAAEYFLRPTVIAETEDGKQFTFDAPDPREKAEDRLARIAKEKEPMPAESEWTPETLIISFRPGFPAHLRADQAKATFDLLRELRRKASEPLLKSVGDWCLQALSGDAANPAGKERFGLRPGLLIENVDAGLMQSAGVDHRNAKGKIKSVSIYLLIGFRSPGSDTTQLADLLAPFR